MFIVAHGAKDLGVTDFYGLVDRLRLSLDIGDGAFCFSWFLGGSPRGQ